MSLEDERRAVLADIARTIARAAGKGRGFALFLYADGEWSYASNAERTDIVKVLEEWLQKTSGALVADSKETEEATGQRLELEDRCVKIGRVLSASGSPAILFLFDTPIGNLAYFISPSGYPGARAGVRRWVENERGTTP